MEFAVVLADRGRPVIEFAARELQSLLEKTTALLFGAFGAQAQYAFTLAADPALPPTAFAVAIARRGGRLEVGLSGHDDAGVLHAVYTLLETCGARFDILGPQLPDRIDLDALPEGRRVVTPFVRRRGIRQHINFAMDVSSYPLAEALEYIRSLARLRMNHITFHSYNGQWFGFAQPDGTWKHGGNFFYGTRFDLPADPLFRRNIRNRAVYCIPEIEAVVDQPEVRSRMATEWLNAVMAECRRCGLHVQLSIEPPGRTDEEGLAVCRDVLRLYPGIDTLELITPECGGSERTLTVPELKDYLVELFGEGVPGDAGLLAGLKDNLGQLQGGLRNCARNLRLLAALRADPRGPLPALAAGAYVTCPDSLRVLHAVLERYAPPDVSLTFLPAHGARRAVANLGQMGFTPASIRRTLLYGWIEFDGNMYLQQNSVVGARQMLEFAHGLAAPEAVAGVALNHWRTAENRACIAYAGRAFIEGPIDPLAFYREYAGAFGIADAGRLAAILQELDELDDLAREKMFNIGFCANGCWVRPGLRWTLRWDGAAIDAARQRYGAVLRELESCLATAARPAGREWLRFLANRVECTLLQLECAQAMKSLGSFCDHEHPERLTPEQKQTVAETCDRALALARRYLEKHAAMILDRGCEGTLISYQTTLPHYIEHIRAVFVTGEKTCRHFLPQFDEPPPPTVV